MKYLFLLFVLSFGIPTFSQLSSRNMLERKINVTEEHNKLSSAVYRLKGELSTLTNSLEEKWETVKRYQEQYSASVGGVFGFFGGTGDEQIKTLLDSAKKEYDNFEEKQMKSIIAHRNAIEAIERHLSSEEEALTREKENYDRHLKNLRSQIKNMKLSDKFDDLESDFKDVGDRIDQIEEVYDQGLLGAYLQSKIGKLLNSDVLCSANRLCEDPSLKEVKSSKIRDELFPETSSREHYMLKLREDSARRKAQ